MATKMPPVPPASRSPKGTGSTPSAPKDTSVEKQPENLEEEGRFGNIYQNTHNQGYQQDR